MTPSVVKIIRVSDKQKKREKIGLWWRQTMANFNG